jgi:hypothetical protein
MTPKPETSTPLVAEEPEPQDLLLERWLARSSASHARVRAAAALPRSSPPEPIGDGLADAWFK